LAIVACLSFPQIGRAVNSSVWEASNSLKDTTNYTGLASFYWFANFDNPSAVTLAAMDDHEARNLPAWLHLETRPAFIGKDDSGANSDTTSRTGFSFSESGANGATSIGGQPAYNRLTLPNGTSGVSGFAADNLNASTGGGNTSSMLTMRVLAGAPSTIRMWVVTDNSGDLDTSEAEALPNGQRLITGGSDPQANNGIADAWAWRLSDLNDGDIITVRPTSSAANDIPGFAGLMIQVVPEPSSLAVALMGVLGLGRSLTRRCRD
jgi:hypothetical protein